MWIHLCSSERESLSCSSDEGEKDDQTSEGNTCPFPGPNEHDLSSSQEPQEDKDQAHKSSANPPEIANIGRINNPECNKNYTVSQKGIQHLEKKNVKTYFSEIAFFSVCSSVFFCVELDIESPLGSCDGTAHVLVGCRFWRLVYICFIKKKIHDFCKSICLLSCF